MKHRKWILLGALLTLIGVSIAGFAVARGDFSPRDYVANHYTRSSSDDIGNDAVAYRSSTAQSAVVKEITTAWRPANQHIDSSGAYLQYDDDAVVILPIGAGSLILVEKLLTAYPRYSHRVGSHWGSSRGSRIRGGGPGSGK